MPRVAVPWAVVVFLGRARAVAAATCNGDERFCALPFTMHTFPGSHNSGSFDLNIPEIVEDNVIGLDVNHALACFYDTHHMNYVEQLNFGIRFFIPDICTRASGKPNTFYDCHSASGTDESMMGWGTEFNDSVQHMRDWLDVHPRELLVVAPANVHSEYDRYDYAETDRKWFALFGEKFSGPCVQIGADANVSTLPSKAETTCVHITGRPPDSITMGELIDRNLRMMVFSRASEAEVLVNTWDSSVNVGANSKDLLEHLEMYADGLKPLMPNSLIRFAMIGAASEPDFTNMKACRDMDPICNAMMAKASMEEMDLRCVERMATSYNTDLLQDDTHPYTYFTGKECPDTPCGCLGYQSPLEVAHQKLLDQGHRLIVIETDYHELGEKHSIIQVTRRMNEANLRRLENQPELARTWWDCNWIAVLCVSLPSVILCLCCCYGCLICLYPEHYGLWIRRAWERHQDVRAMKRVAREAGREEARAYLRNANGNEVHEAPSSWVNPQSVGVTSVAPPAAAVQVDQGYYNAKETE